MVNKNEKIRKKGEKIEKIGFYKFIYL